MRLSTVWPPPPCVCVSMCLMTSRWTGYGCSRVCVRVLGKGALVRIYRVMRENGRELIKKNEFVDFFFKNFILRESDGKKHVENFFKTKQVRFFRYRNDQLRAGARWNGALKGEYFIEHLPAVALRGGLRRVCFEDVL